MSRSRNRRLNVGGALKTVLRSYARNRIIKKRLPADLGGGPVFCSPDAILSTWKPGWQASQTLHLFEWARLYVKPGHIIWDIGANQGLFSFAALAASAPSGHVVAFEPDPFLAGLLHRTRKAQAAESHIDILPLAIASGSRLAAFSVAAKDRALNHLTAVTGNPRTGGERDRLTVMTVTLAWVAAQMGPPDLIKIDVEGAELDVLRGAGATLLLDVRPHWIIEVANQNAVEIAAILRDADYRLFNANQPEREVEWPAWNTLAVPAEKL